MAGVELLMSVSLTRFTLLQNAKMDVSEKREVCRTNLTLADTYNVNILLLPSFLLFAQWSRLLRAGTN